MILEFIQIYCLSKPLVTEDMKWGDNLCFSVGGKLFLIVSLDEIPMAASFKVDDDDFDNICNQNGFIQAPYFAKNKWVKLLDINLKCNQEWKIYIDNAYNLIKQKLTKKLQLQIDEANK